MKKSKTTQKKGGFMKQGKEEELRLTKHIVSLTNQNIIELSYLTKNMLGMNRGPGHFSFEEWNCYNACLHLCWRLLKVVDKKYQTHHKKLIRFYEDEMERATLEEVL